LQDVAADFERYWNCASVSTLRQVLELSETEIAEKLHQALFCLSQ
jgi:putative cardiolipin synthase